MNFKKLLLALLITSVSISSASNAVFAAPSKSTTSEVVNKKEVAVSNTRFVRQKAAEEAKKKREAEAEAKKKAAEAKAEAKKKAAEAEAEAKKQAAETTVVSPAAIAVKTPEQLAKERAERKAAAYAEPAAISVFDTYYDYLFGAWVNREGEPMTTHPGSSLSFKTFGTDRVTLELAIRGSVTLAVSIDDGAPEPVADGVVILPDFGWHDVCIFVDSVKHEYGSSVTIKSINIGEGNVLPIDKEQYLFLGDSLFEGMNDLGVGASSFVQSIPYEAATQYDVIAYERRLPVAVAAPGSGLLKTEYYPAAVDFFTQTPIHCHPTKIFLSFGSNDLKLEAYAQDNTTTEDEESTGTGETDETLEGEGTGETLGENTGDTTGETLENGENTTEQPIPQYTTRYYGQSVEEAVAEEYTKFVAMIKERYPDVPIFVLMPFYNQAYSAAIHSLTDVTIIETNTMTVAYTDGVHPDVATCDYVGSVIKDMADGYDGIITSDYRKNDYVLYEGEYLLGEQVAQRNQYINSIATAGEELAHENDSVRTGQDIQEAAVNASVTSNATEGTTMVAPEKKAEAEADFVFVDESENTIEEVLEQPGTAPALAPAAPPVSNPSTPPATPAASAEQPIAEQATESIFEKLLKPATEEISAEQFITDIFDRLQAAEADKKRAEAEQKRIEAEKKMSLKVEKINEEERKALIPSYIYKRPVAESEETGIGALVFFEK